MLWTALVTVNDYEQTLIREPFIERRNLLRDHFNKTNLKFDFATFADVRPLFGAAAVASDSKHCMPALLTGQ